MLRIVLSSSTISRPTPSRYRLYGPCLSPRPISRRPVVFAAKGVLEPPVVECTDTEPVASTAYEPLTTQQVKDLVTLICEETKVAKLEIKLGSYELKIKRNVGHINGQPVHLATDTKNNGIVESVPLPCVEGSSVEDSFIEDESGSSLEESLILIDSPKVGYFRKGVYNKNGKKVGKGPKAGDQVRSGQVICVIEQLGTFTPILAPQQGEIISFPFSDGESVAYKDCLVEFAPYFGGHIIGDKKYK